MFSQNEAVRVISLVMKRRKEIFHSVPQDIGVKGRETSSILPPRKTNVDGVSGARGK